MLAGRVVVQEQYYRVLHELIAPRPSHLLIRVWELSDSMAAGCIAAPSIALGTNVSDMAGLGTLDVTIWAHASV